MWTEEGDTVHILSGHTSFVYSISVLPNGDIVSGGEDRSLRVWKDGSCHQTIIHPAISVWRYPRCRTAILLVGAATELCEFSALMPSRWASSDELKSYDDAVATQLLPRWVAFQLFQDGKATGFSQQVGDLKKTDLPGPEALLQPGLIALCLAPFIIYNSSSGKKDGQVIMIRSRDIVEAHQVY